VGGGGGGAEAKPSIADIDNKSCQREEGLVLLGGDILRRRADRSHLTQSFVDTSIEDLTRCY